MKPVRNVPEPDPSLGCPRFGSDVPEGLEPETLLATILATGGTERDAGAALVAAMGWRAAARALGRRLPEDPFGTVRALPDVVWAALAGSRADRRDLRAILDDLGVSPIAVALGLTPKRSSIELLTAMGFGNFNQFGPTKVFAPPETWTYGQWPPNLRIVPVSLNLRPSGGPFATPPRGAVTLPAGLAVDGDLLLSRTNIQALPPGLWVTGDLNLLDCPQWEGRFPLDARIDGTILQHFQSRAL
jgi:hypothetical protein